MLCAHILILCAHTLILYAHILILCAHILILCAHISILCAHIFTYIDIVCTYIGIVCTYIDSVYHSHEYVVLQILLFLIFCAGGEYLAKNGSCTSNAVLPPHGCRGAHIILQLCLSYCIIILGFIINI